MSRKKLYSRLNQIFSDFEQAEEKQPDNQGLKLVQGWAWECTQDGLYTYCDPAVKDFIGISASDFIGKSAFSFAIHAKTGSELKKAIRRNIAPIELKGAFVDSRGEQVEVNIQLIRTKEDSNGSESSNESEFYWRGFTQVFPSGHRPITKPQNQSRVHPPKPLPSYQSTEHLSASTLSSDKLISPSLNSLGVAFYKGDLHQSTSPWTPAGTYSFSTHQPVYKPAEGHSFPATITFPFLYGDQGKGLIEIVDENDLERRWTDDEILLVEEIAGQMALALENAELYVAVQQELADRIRAEQETSKRNQDLATLNRIGQELSKLSTREEVLNILFTTIGQILDNRNLTIALYNQEQKTFSFPIHTVNGDLQPLADRMLDSGVPDFIVQSKAPLMMNGQVNKGLQLRGITPLDPPPLSLLAVPMLAGDQPIGAIVLQNFESDQAYDSIHIELIFTIASQATTALENANLFNEIRAALAAIENRERYQSNIAKAVSMLTEFGTRSLPQVLETLAKAALSLRVYFARAIEDAKGVNWVKSAEWIESGKGYLVNQYPFATIPTSEFAFWLKELREKGWVAGNLDNFRGAERIYLQAQNIRSTLLIAVPGNTVIPSFIAFDEFERERVWSTDEIDSLRVAADAISNTIIREVLLEQVQLSLNETEKLYNASRGLAVAGSLQEMVAIIAQGSVSDQINRAVLATFTLDAAGKITEINVAANWFNGHGTPPLAVGDSYPPDDYEKLFSQRAPVFFEDILEAPIDVHLRELLSHQKVRSLAILPLWVGKRQLGVLLLQSEDRYHFSDHEMRFFPPLVGQMAISVENFRLFEQTQKALAETGLLYRISSAIAEATDPQQLITLVASNILPSRADRATLMQIITDADGDPLELEIVGIYDTVDANAVPGLRLPASSLPLINLLGSEAIVLPDAPQADIDLISKNTLIQHQILSASLVPLRSAGKLVGIVIVSSRQPAIFSQEEINLLQVASNGMTVALERFRLLKEAQRRALELQAAAEIARDTTSTLSIDTLLNRIVNLVCDRFNYYFSAIYLVDEGSNYATVREAFGEAGKKIKNEKYKFAIGSKSVVGTVASTRAPLLINDVSVSPIYRYLPELAETKSELALPLKLGDRIIGVLDIHSTDANAFNSDDVSVLQILSDQIAVGIDNARSYELSQKAVAEMQEVDRIKSQFLANMSHELRTPLNSIIGFSRVILKGIDGPINEIQAQDLAAIYNSGQHLLNLINDILDLSKIEAGKMELAFTELDLGDVIKSVMSTAVGLVKDKPIKLIQKVPEDLPKAMADVTRIRQVLLNLIANAAKFTEKGSITVEASQVRSPSGKPELMVTITDTGPGIADEDKAKLFQRFSQVDDSPTRKTGGSGLGLYISRNFIEMHGGRIGLLKTELGVGSTFFFTLPLPLVEEISKDELADLPVILCIDDDPRVISLYERFLTPNGYQVVPLTDPIRAVEYAKTYKPLAITLDIMMPERDGWQVMYDLNSHPETRNIPIVICSIVEQEDKGINLGAADYLVKPFLQDDLINAINRLNKEGTIHRVLMIDDDPDDLRLVKRMLEATNKYKLITAENAREGLEIISSEHPDAIILDLFMPEMDGFALLQKIRSNEELASLPVIVLTGADLTPEQHQELDHFGQQMLSKNYLNQNKLLSLLEGALNRIRT